MNTRTRAKIHLWALAAVLAGPLAVVQVAGAEDAGPNGAPAYETATFSMYCYWTGEATVGRVPGVVASRIGHLDGHEVVEVTYDSGRTGVGELAQALKRQSSLYSLIVASPAEQAVAEGYLKPSEIAVRRGETRYIASKHSLQVRHPDLYFLDLTEEQAIALNAWSHFGGPMPDVLSPDQERRWHELQEKLGRKRPAALKPDGARSGAALDAYRQALEAWLAE